MTSSLVGSEMCIRDSIPPPLQAKKDPWQHVIDTCTRYTQAEIVTNRSSEALLRGPQAPVQFQNSAIHLPT
eukprot:12347342-Prorocentrum_lima.AAC.1